jgi:hypothetical protein
LSAGRDAEGYRAQALVMLGEASALRPTTP